MRLFIRPKLGIQGHDGNLRVFPAVHIPKGDQATHIVVVRPTGQIVDGVGLPAIKRPLKLTSGLLLDKLPATVLIHQCWIHALRGVASLS